MISTEVNDREKVPRTLLFTYPHGERPFISQILSLMAVFSSLSVLPILSADHTFMCAVYESNSVPYYYCFPLLLTSESYFKDQGREGWAGAIQAGAFFGFISAALGFVSISILMSAVCFGHRPRRLMAVAIMLAVAAASQLMTFSAASVDICRGLGADCSKTDVHFDTGAVYALVAFILYLAAIPFVITYFMSVRREFNDEKQRQEEASNGLGAVTGKDSSVVVIGGAAMATANTPDTGSYANMASASTTEPHGAVTAGQADEQQEGGGTGASVYSGVGSLGERRTEREYIDESGRLIREVIYENN